MLNRFALLPLLMAICSLIAHAQSGSRGRPSVFDEAPSAASSSSRSSNEEAPALGSPEAEMIARRTVAAEEAAHKEHTGRAREAAQLSAELRAAFEHTKALDRTDLKKLERLEKLIKRIRSRAGGSGDGEDSSLTAPPDLSHSLTRLAELSDELYKAVEKTARQVVSASIIERANELLELISQIRSFVQR